MFSTAGPEAGVASRAMDSNARVVIGALLSLLGCGGLCVCAGLVGMGSMIAEAPMLEVEIETAQREGSADGSGGDTELCLTRGHERGATCGWGLSCGVVVDEYLRACLRSVPIPDPSLCIGVPPPSMVGDLDFEDRFCGARGWESDMGCTSVVDSLETHCASF